MALRANPAVEPRTPEDLTGRDAPAPHRRGSPARKPMRALPHLPRWDWVAWTLAGIVLIGSAMRVYFLIVYHPALIGVADSANYILAAQHNLFYDPDRVAGYVLFLRFLHLIWPRLILVAIAQHALGLVGGLLLYDSVRRIGLPRGLGLVPAAVVILSGYGLILEHAVLTDATFIFLVYLSIWCIVRAWRGSRWWALAAGIVLDAATDVRTVGLELLPLAVICLCLPPAAEIARRIGSRPVRWPNLRWVPGGRLMSSHRVAAWRAALLTGGGAGALLLILPFLVAHQQATGVFNFTTAGNLQLYGRVAPWADCSKFTPPSGTAGLCPTQPVWSRLGSAVWKFEAPYPISNITGWDYQTAANNRKMGAFSVAAIEGEPLTYLEYVGRDLVRVVDPSFPESPNPAVGNTGGGFTEEQSVAATFDPAASLSRQALVASYYPSSRLHMGNTSVIRSWASDTKLTGPAMAMTLLLALVAPLLTNGLPRRFALMMVAYSFILIVGPILVADYDYRYEAAAFGPLSIAAAIGAYRLWQSVRGRLRAGRPAA